MNASADFPSLDGLPTFSKMSILALSSYFETLDSHRGEDDIADLFELVGRIPLPPQSIPADHRLREILRPYLLRYHDLLSKELDSIRTDEEDLRGDTAELIQTLRAFLGLSRFIPD
jgi:hypothetical protein